MDIIKDTLKLEMIDKDEKIGVFYLKAIWKYYQDLRTNGKSAVQIEWKYINAVCNTLGVGLEPTLMFLQGNLVSFNEFEDWIIKNGVVSEAMVNYFNRIVSGQNDDALLSEEKVLSDKDLEHWDKYGYIIIKNAIPKDDAAEARELVYETIDAQSEDASTWYKEHPLRQGIMVQLFNAPILNKNRLSRKIRLAYLQIWKRSDLLVSMDRVSFNPPENEQYQFPGPNLHWDVSLKRPIPFGVQGLLYLSDTNPDQGAFTLVPGFHNIIEEWLGNLKSHQNPRLDKSLLDSFEKKSIAAKAGDFIIWDQRLPHGSSPNRAKEPRVVQYINYQPIDLEYHGEWV